MFAVGSKVLCVDATFKPTAENEYMYLPRKGVVYTVRRVIEVPDEGTGILLQEIFNRPVQIIGSKSYGQEPLFSAARFRGA